MRIGARERGKRLFESERTRRRPQGQDHTAFIVRCRDRPCPVSCGVAQACCTAQMVPQGKGRRRCCHRGVDGKRHLCAEGVSQTRVGAAEGKATAGQPRAHLGHVVCMCELLKPVKGTRISDILVAREVGLTRPRQRGGSGLGL